MRSSRAPLMSFQRIGIEAFFLVLAVFFALAVDEAWQDHENSKAAKKALSRIHQELGKNSKLIRSESEQHKLELERIQPLIERLDSEYPAPDDLDTNVRISVSILRDTAWRSAQFSDALKYLPYEKIEPVTTAYSLQQLYQIQSSQAFIIQGNVSFIEATPAVQLRSSFEVLRQLYAIEQSLLSVYEQIPMQTESVTQ
jgi:hypothetical protein